VFVLKKRRSKSERVEDIRGMQSGLNNTHNLNRSTTMETGGRTPDTRYMQTPTFRKCNDGAERVSLLLV
jgi:hypothetical protein